MGRNTVLKMCLDFFSFAITVAASVDSKSSPGGVNHSELPVPGVVNFYHSALSLSSHAPVTGLDI